MQKQKIYIEIYGDILREIKQQKQKTKVSTQSWDEKKLQNMIGKNSWECKNKRFTKRYMETSWEKKNNKNKRLWWAHNLEMKKKLQNMIGKNRWGCKNKRFTKRYMETSWERKNNKNKRLRWAHNLEMKKNYRIW